MRKYLMEHEAWINTILAGNPTPEEAARALILHETRTARMQHERLIHLIVTVFICLFLLLAVGFSMVHPTLPGLIISILLVIQASCYIIHYFRLENGVQRWYRLADRLEEIARGRQDKRAGF